MFRRAFFLFAIFIFFVSCGKKGEDIVGTVNKMEITTPELLANGLSTAVIAATVYNSDGEISGGLKVQFTTTAGSISEYAFSDDQGLAFATLKSSASEEDVDVTITATVVDTSKSLKKGTPTSYKVSLDVLGKSNRRLGKKSLEGDNSAELNLIFLGVQVRASLDAPSLPADGISKAKLNISVKETTSKKAINQASIALRAIYGNVPNALITNDQGLAKAEIVSQTKSGTDTIYVEYGDLISKTIILKYDETKLKLAPDSAKVVAGGKSKLTMTASLLTLQNTPIVGAEIKFSTSDGVISGSAITDKSGNAIVELISGSNPNPNVTVIAHFYELADTASVAFVETAGSGGLSLTGDAQVYRDGSSTIQITATVLNNSNEPAANMIVDFTTSIGNITPTATTDASGKAIVSFKGDAGDVDVIAKITATTGSMSAIHEIKLLGIWMEVTSTPDSILSDGQSTAKITAHIKLASTNIAVSNVPVNFSTDLGAIPNLASTNQEGLAVNKLTSANKSGVAHVNVAFGAITKSIQVYFFNDMPTGLSLSGDAQVYRNGSSAIQVTATVLNKFNKPLAGAGIQFTTTVGSITPTATTDASGKAVVSFTGDAGAGDVIAKITATTGSISSIHEVKLLGIWMEVTSTPDSILADGQSTAKITTHIKLASTNIAVSNAPVDFSTDLGAIPNLVSTNQEGLAVNKLTSANQAGTAHVNVAFGAITKSIQVYFFKDMPTGLSLSGDAQVYRDGSSAIQVTATVLNKSNEPVANTIVNFTSSYGSITPTATTDASGKAVVAFTGDAGDADVIAEITATTGSISATHDVKLLGIWMEVTSVPDSILADGQSTAKITTHIKLASTNIAVSNVPVNFSTDLGAIPNLVSTNQEGLAVNKLTSANQAGTAHVNVAFGTITKSIQVYFFQDMPTSLSLSSDAQVYRNGSSAIQVTATVLNKSNEPVANTIVKFTSSIGSITPTATTDASGKAVVSFTGDAGDVDVIAKITATTGSISATHDVKLLGIWMEVTSTPDSILADGQSTAKITTHIKLASTNIAVSNVPVNFSTDLGAIPNLVSTNQKGLAVNKLTSANQAGAAHVNVAFGTVTKSVQVYFFKDRPTSLSLSGETQVYRNGASNIPIAATVLNKSNEPVANTTVNFTTSIGSITPTATTDASGKAVVSFTGDAGDGDVIAKITATTGSIFSTHDVKLLGIWMEVTSTPDSIPADGQSTAQITTHIKLASTNIAVANASVNFSTNLGSILNNAVTNAKGLAISTLSSATQTGIAHVTATFGAMSKNIDIYFFDNMPNSINLSAEPNFIWVKETGNIEQTIITATVLGVTGQPVSRDVKVKFYLRNGPGGGEFIEPSVAGSTSESQAIRTFNGQASVKLRAGTISGTVEIKAELVDYPQIQVRTTNIVIRSGPPYIWIDPNDKNNVVSHMTLSFDYKNLAGWNHVKKFNLGIYLSDKYNNPVEQGTAVYLTTTGGIVTTDVRTDELGEGAAILTTVNPRPYVKPEDETALSPLAIPNPNDPSLVLPIIIPDFEGGEVLNSAGNYAENDGIVVVLATTHGRDQFGNDAIVYTTATAVFSGSILLFTVAANKTSLAIGESAAIQIRVYDINGNPPAAGSSLAASSSAGNLAATNLMADASMYGYGSTSYVTSVLNDLSPVDGEPTTAQVTVELNSPNGRASGTVFIHLQGAAGK